MRKRKITAVLPREKRAIFLAAALFCVALPAAAQNSAVPASGAMPASGGATAFPAPSPGLKLLLAEENDLDDVRALSAASDVQAVSLGASLTALQRDPATALALEKWVRGGGTVFLHTDAAQLFGYLTTPARLTTNARAGQLFGRARAALPFGANSLLWSARRETVGNAASLQSAFSAPAVQTVFYEMQAGDDLIVSHPAATPLLRVSDVTGDDSAPLYAAAIAPYGRGWAVFTPRRIEQNRADGAAFAQNLLRLAASTPRVLAGAGAAENNAVNAASTRSAPQFLSLPSSLLEALSAQASSENFDAAAWLSSLFVLTLDPNAAPTNATAQNATAQNATAINANGTDANNATTNSSGVYAADDATPYESGLMIERRELNALLQLLNVARGGDAAASTRAWALIFVWRARLEVQRDNAEAARAWISQAAAAAPNAAETLFWQGVVALNEAASLEMSAPRAQAFRAAAALWRAAPAAMPLSGAPDASRALAPAWAGGAEQAARLAEATPDYAATGARNLTFYNGGNDNTFRYFSAQTANFGALSNSFGWRADDLSLVAFSSYREYSRFRSAIGLPPQNLAFNVGAQSVDLYGGEISTVNGNVRTIYPRAVLGDVVGATLLTVAPQSALGNGARRASTRTGIATLPPTSLMPASQLLVRAMLNTLLQDGAAPPRWMDLGLLVIADRESAVTRSPGDVAGNVQRPLFGRGYSGFRQPFRSGNPVTTVKPPLFGNGNVSARTLRDLWRANRLLSAPQFENEALLNGETGALAVEEARSLMAFFYRRYGAGRVVETLQRIGAGQSPDAAMNATIGLNQAQFFTAWSRAEFGNR